MTSCYLCGSTSYSQRPGSVRDRYDIQVLECNGCSLVYLSSFEHIQDYHYEKSGMHGNERLSIDVWLKETESDDARRFEFLKSKLIGKNVLDFGCGCGGFLIKARNMAQSVQGIEPELRLQEFFKHKDIEVNYSIESLKSQAGFFDLITAFHVIEHLPDPRTTLKNLSGFLKTGGELIVEVPNADDVLLTLFECEPFSQFTYWSQHLFLFNVKTLPELIHQAGLKLHWLKQIQRYPLSNHLYWLAKGKPGGHQIWNFIDSQMLNDCYVSQLAALGRCDTLMAGVGL